MGYKIAIQLQLLKMKRIIASDLQVSPWEHFYDTIKDQYSITKKVYQNTPQNKIKLNFFQKPRAGKQQTNQIFIIYDKPKPKQIAGQGSLKQLKPSKSPRILKKLKQRLNTVNFEDSRPIQQQKIVQQNQEQQQEKKESPTGKQSSRLSRLSRKRENFKVPIMNINIKRKKVDQGIRYQYNDNEIFQKRDIFSNKSNERFKSTKQLILPKIKMCTIE